MVPCRLPTRVGVVLAVLLLTGAPQSVRAHGTEHQKTAPPAPEAAAREVWGCPMCETVREEAPGRCPLCLMDLVRMEATPDGSGPVSDGHVLPARNERGGKVAIALRVARGTPAPLMPGVPDWLFYTTATCILGLSFVLLDIRGRRRSQRPARGRRWNLMRIPGLRSLLRRRWFVVGLQLPFVLIFGMILFAGLFGNPDPARNIAPALTWTLWWTWLAIVIVFMGKLWCTVCPWMAVADWIAKLGLVRKDRRPLGLEKRWPRRLRNIWLATGLFLFLTWLELGYGVTNQPWLTAALGLLMVAAAVGTVLVFERKAFCRYACLVGRVSGLYSMFAASELRSDDESACRSCATRDCFHGNERGAPCPTHQFIGAMDTNTYCTLCMECVASCPKDNVAWNVRPFGADLIESKRARVDEAYLAVILLSMSAFHGLTMTPVWDRLVDRIQAVGGVSHLAAFTIGMGAMIALPLVIYYGICALIKLIANDRDHSVRLLFIRFSYSLLPIALFYHLAHNLQHIFFEGKKIVRGASDPFGWGWDLFGTAELPVDAVLPIGVGWSLQVALIIVGHVFGIVIAHKTAAALYGNRNRATLSQLPMLVAMLLFSFQSLWLIAQPMVMRTAM